MATEDGHSARNTMATVVATAAVTVAIGVTALALGGYLGPGASTGETAPAPQVAAAEAPIRAPEAEKVILVPIAPDVAPAPVATPAEPQLLAAYEPVGRYGDDRFEDDEDEEHEEHHRARRQYDREDDDDDD